MVNRKKKNNICVEVSDCHGYTPLIGACFNGNLPCAANLLNKGYNLDYNGNSDVYPLGAAIFSNYNNRVRKELVTLLIKSGANVNQESADGTTALFIASDCGYLDIVEILLQHKSAVNLCYKDGSTPLWIASKRGNLDVVKRLHKHKANINCKTNDGMSGLYIACLRGRSTVVEYLLRHGACVNTLTAKGKTALHAACEYKYLDIVKKLIAKKAKINVQDKEGNSPLMIAANHGYFVVIKHLVSCGANIDLVNRNNETALHIAAAGGYRKTVAFLLESNPKVLRNKQGCFPSDVAKNHGEVSLAAQLELYEQLQKDTQNDWLCVTRLKRMDSNNRLSRSSSRSSSRRNSITIEGPTITDITPVDPEFPEGTDVVIVATFADSLSKEIMWEHNDRVIQPDEHISIDTDDSMTTLTIGKCGASDSGKYTVTIHNDHGHDSECTNVYVEPKAPLMVDLTPAPPTCQKGQPVVFTAMFYECDNADVVWMFNREKVEEGDNMFIKTKSTSSELHIRCCDVTDEGVYTVGLVSSYGSDYLSTELTVRTKENVNSRKDKKSNTQQPLPVCVYSRMSHQDESHNLNFSDMTKCSISCPKLAICVAYIQSKYQIFKAIMFTEPVLDVMLGNHMIDIERKNQLTAIGERQGISKQINSLLDDLLSNGLMDCMLIHKFKESLELSRYHTNRTLAKMIPEHEGPLPQDPDELLTSEEYKEITENFYQEFLNSSDAPSVKRELITNNILHPLQVEKLKPLSEMPYHAAHYMMDQILLRGTFQTVEAFSKALSHIDQHILAELLPKR